MALQGDSGTTYLAKRDACNRAGGFHYVGSKGRAMLSRPTRALAKATKSAVAPAVEAQAEALPMSAQLLAGF